MVGVAGEYEGRRDGPHPGDLGAEPAIEGRVYSDLQAWQADPKRVQQLCGWDWSRKTLKALPANTQVIQS